MIPLLVLAADPTDGDLLARISQHLDRGGVLGYPTETVYGLGAQATEQGVKTLRELKGRDEGKPFLVLLPASDAGVGEGASRKAPSWGAEGIVGDEQGLVWTPSARRLADAFWPGPLTLVLSDPDGYFPSGVRSTAGTVGVRVSPHPFVTALLGVMERPLLSTSANRPGREPARTANEVAEAVQGRPGIDRLWIADGGPLPNVGISTVVDCTELRPRVLRAGVVSEEEIARVLAETHG